MAGLAGAIALFLYYRLRQLGSPLAFDEYASIYFSQHGLSSLWGPWIVRETNPPLFYTLLRGWRALVPATETSLRLLPLTFCFLHLALLARFVRRRYGPAAAILAVLLLAVSASDIYQSTYLRGYGLAQLGVLLSFIGLVEVTAANCCRPRGLLEFIGGAVVAIYCHTTMLLWPLVAAAAVLLDWAIVSGLTRADVLRVAAASAAILVLSAWVIVTAVLQLHAHSANISWIEALDLDSLISTVNLQLLLDGVIGSATMLVLMTVGAARTFHLRETRLALFVLVLGVAALKAVDWVHPVITDYTLHWAFSFTAILAGAALAPGNAPRSAPRFPAPLTATAVLAGVALLGPWSLQHEAYIPTPQDWQAAIRRVDSTPGAAMLVSHESVAVVVQQACMIEFQAATCPFPLVVVANPAQTDSWAFGGYRGRIVSAFGVRRALGNTQSIFAFSRYVYRPLDPFGLDKGDYAEVSWDDGELIGPIPVDAFDVRPFSQPPVPDPPDNES